MGFGYPVLEKALCAWQARAIFNTRSSRPLDILHDRQDWHCELPEEAAAALRRSMAELINKVIMPEWQKRAGLFSANEDRVATVLYTWPHDEDYVVAVQGSPNASYGYFYLCVNLIQRVLAPAQSEPERAPETTHRMRRLQGGGRRLR